MDGISKAVELLGKEDEQHQQQYQHPTTSLANVIDTQHQRYLENYFSFGNEEDAMLTAISSMSGKHSMIHHPADLVLRLP